VGNFLRWASPWVLAAAVASPLWLAGCANTRTAKETHSVVLLSVMLRADLAGDGQPTGLIVTVDERGTSAGQQFAFAPNTRIPGHYTTFLVRLALPAGQHHLTGLSGVTSAGVPAPAFDVTLDMPLQARNNSTDYLGHLELTYTGSVSVHTAASSVVVGSTLVLADAYQDDLPDIVHAWPSLRGQRVARRVPPGIVAIPATPRDLSALDAQLHPQELGGAARLDASAAAVLPARARAAFHTFLKSSYPRAFAVSATGYTGLAAGGTDVIQRALRSCRRMQQPGEKSSCRPFALDDTLISSLQGTPRVVQK
jgi:hypothetical protein